MCKGVPRRRDSLVKSEAAIPILADLLSNALTSLQVISVISPVSDKVGISKYRRFCDKPTVTAIS